MAKKKEEIVKMSKNEIKKELKERLDMPSIEVAGKVLDVVVEVIKEGIMRDIKLNKGKAAFQVPGLGTFKTSLMKGREMENPILGKKIKIPTQYIGKFTLTKTLKEEITACAKPFLKGVK